jgi:hypothetical protein
MSVETEQVKRSCSASDNDMTNKSPKNDPIIDLTELVEGVRGDGLEHLARLILRKKGLTVEHSGRGADQGKDMLARELRKGPIGDTSVRWLVNCKDNSIAGKAVSENDVGSITDKLKQHHADGFMLFTTTTPGSALKSLLDSIDKSNGGEYDTCVFDKADITTFLLDESNHHLIQQFLPASYKRLKGLTSLKDAISLFGADLPEHAISELMRITRTYTANQLRGSDVFPDNSSYALAWDRVVGYTLTTQDTEQAWIASRRLPEQATRNLMSKLLKADRDATRPLLLLAKDHSRVDLAYDAATVFADNFTLMLHEIDDVAGAVHLGAIANSFTPALSQAVRSEIMDAPGKFGIDSKVSEMPGQVCLEWVDDVTIDISETYENKHPFSVNFEGRIELFLTARFGDEEDNDERYLTYEGNIGGNADWTGVEITDLDIDWGSDDGEPTE